MFCLNIANFKCCAVMFSSLGKLFVGGFAHWFEKFCKIRDDIIAKIISIVSSVKCEEFLDLTVTLKAILRWHICFMQWVLTKGNNEEKWFHALIRIDKYEPIYSTSANCTIWILSFRYTKSYKKLINDMLHIFYKIKLYGRMIDMCKQDLAFQIRQATPS